MAEPKDRTESFPHSEHVSTIDTLRAIAILCVIAHHLYIYTGFRFPNLDLNGGVIGVQLFFLISGYLIIQSAMKYPWRVFAIHRFFRIFPPYLAALLFFAIGKYLLQDGYRVALTERWPYFLLNILNLQYLHPISIFQLDPIHVSWSLTVELLWYLLAPVLVYVIGKGSSRNTRWLAALLTFSIVATVWVYLGSAGKFDFLYESSLRMVGLRPDSSSVRHSFIDNAPPAQMVYFLIGASLYLYRQQLFKLPTSILWIASSSVLLFVPSWNVALGIYPNILTGVGCAALFLWIRRVGIHDKLTTWIAKVSYSIYLVHVPILLIIFKHLNITGWPGLVLATLSVAIASELSWRFIEAPAQRFGKHLAAKVVVHR